MKNDYGTEPIKNALDRMRNYFCRGNKENKKLFLITKEDGSQRYIKATYCEFYKQDKEAHFYQEGQFINGTTFTKVLNVEEITEG